MREFIALELNKEAIEELERVKKLIEDAGLVEARFVARENMHLTLRFLGDITEKEEGMVRAALGSVNMKKFEAKLGNIGVFGKGRDVRVIWAALTGEEIFNLWDKIRFAIADLFKEEEKFESHVTIARVKNIEDKKKLFEFLNKADVKKIEFDISDFVLKRSTLTDRGPVYWDVERFRLEG